MKLNKLKKSPEKVTHDSNRVNTTKHVEYGPNTRHIRGYFL